jgi:hypothetical protein
MPRASRLLKKCRRERNENGEGKHFGDCQQGRRASRAARETRPVPARKERSRKRRKGVPLHKPYAPCSCATSVMSTSCCKCTGALEESVEAQMTRWRAHETCTTKFEVCKCRWYGSEQQWHERIKKDWRVIQKVHSTETRDWPECVRV